MSKEYVADTHAAIWYLSNSKRLSRQVRSIFEKAVDGHAHVVLPSIVVVETVFLMQRQQVDIKIVESLLRLTENPTDGIYIYPLNKGVVQALQEFGPAAIPELADRIIAATALYLNLPLLTTDAAIQASKLVTTVW